MTHLDFERISELAETGEPNAASREGRHLAECSACREGFMKLRELLSVARSLPPDIAAPPEVWSELQGRIAMAGPRIARRRRWDVARWVGIAAAAILVAGTAMLLPSGPGKPSRAKGAVAQVTVPAAVLSVERQYAPTLAVLRATLDTQRQQLHPAAVSVVNRSLATIDTAIAEARSALTSDPGNSTLVDILSSHYEQKIDLMQRATELATSF